MDSRQLDPLSGGCAWLIADPRALKAEDLLVHGAQGLLLLAQDFSGFSMADFPFGKPLDHVPYLRTMLVGQLVKSVRRTLDFPTNLHWAMFRRIFQ